MRYVTGDPYWIDAKYPGRCANGKCQGHIATGAKAFYWPKGKWIECYTCGMQSEKKFLAEIQDEDWS